MTRIVKLFFAGLCGFFLSVQAVSAEKQEESLYNDPVAQAAFIKEKIREYFPAKAADAMIAVANCESTGWIHWQPDGTLTENKPKKGKKKTSAKGVMQILFNLHKPDYERLGLDMNDIDDYMQYARYLFDTQGPENAWEECTVQMPQTVLASLR